MTLLVLSISTHSPVLPCLPSVHHPSLQLQNQDSIPETQATYGALRPYRESPLLARARRTESFHSYRSSIQPSLPPDLKYLMFLHK